MTMQLAPTSIQLSSAVRIASSQLDVSPAGSRLLEKALSEAGQDSNIKEAYLHVQINNEEAMCFYKKFEFETGEIVANYYKRLNPPDAVILRRVIGSSETP